MDSCGSNARSALATVSPPRPESKTPMGAPAAAMIASLRLLRTLENIFGIARARRSRVGRKREMALGRQLGFAHVGLFQRRLGRQRPFARQHPEFLQGDLRRTLFGLLFRGPP